MCFSCEKAIPQKSTSTKYVPEDKFITEFHLLCSERKYPRFYGISLLPHSRSRPPWRPPLPPFLPPVGAPSQPSYRALYDGARLQPSAIGCPPVTSLTRVPHDPALATVRVPVGDVNRYRPGLLFPPTKECDQVHELSLSSVLPLLVHTSGILHFY